MSRQNYELTGQKMQGYTISKAIGQGKFSIVYRAENQQGVPFALKKIKIFDMADQKQREKCLREVDIMKKLNHPHIIRYIDSFIHNSELIIVTEWAEKGDLKKLIKEKESEDLQFDESNIWGFMKQIASALQHMHEKRIMHRDLKPANIFISQDNTLKIGDLGLGRSFSSQTLEAYSKVGTPLYMSPQLIQDSGYTQNADVWSLGCICYELAQLKSPFRNKEEKMSLMDLFDNITQCNYKSIDSRFSAQLKQAIRNMIVVDTTQRWSSEQVYNYAMKCLQQVKKPLLDPIIAMDDISIKLGLLNYQSAFCKVAERKPIHKIYFAFKSNQEPQNSQFFYFLELAYWIMGLSKPNQKKDRLALTTKTYIDWTSPEAAAKKFITDLEGYGIKVDESIKAKDIRDGHGQAVCYLLNQILTRELIRMNFQFKAPSDTKHEVSRDQFQQQKQKSKFDKQIDEQERSNASSQSLQEQSHFQQSILFPGNNRKDKKFNAQLIAKIEQLQEEENKMMIVGKADERQWRGECLRLEKKFNQISNGAKEARKKHGYSNAETARLCSAKLIDLVKYVKPTTSIVFNCIQADLEKIKKGQSRLKNSFSGTSQDYNQKHQQTMELTNRATNLSNYIRQNAAVLDKTEEKLAQIQGKIKMSFETNESNRCAGLKKAVGELRKQILQMQQKKQILSWQLRRQMKAAKGKSYEDEDYLQQDLA